MRLDKFLKITLVFKTRSSAEKLIEAGKISINGKIAKPSSAVKPGDRIMIVFPFKKVEYEIIEIREKNVSKKDARELMKLIGEETIEL